MESNLNEDQLSKKNVNLSSNELLRSRFVKIVSHAETEVYLQSGLNDMIAILLSKLSRILNKYTHYRSKSLESLSLVFLYFSIPFSQESIRMKKITVNIRNINFNLTLKQSEIQRLWGDLILSIFNLFTRPFFNHKFL